MRYKKKISVIFAYVILLSSILIAETGRCSDKDWAITLAVIFKCKKECKTSFDKERVLSDFHDAFEKCEIKYLNKKSKRLPSLMKCGSETECSSLAKSNKADIVIVLSEESRGKVGRVAISSWLFNRHKGTQTYVTEDRNLISTRSIVWHVLDHLINVSPNHCQSASRLDMQSYKLREIGDRIKEIKKEVKCIVVGAASRECHNKLILGWKWEYIRTPKAIDPRKNIRQDKNDL